MVQPNQLVDVSLKAAQRTVRRTQETLRDIPNAQLVRDVVSTAHVIISAEERLRQRVRAALRVAVATVFLGISGLISLGANVTMAFAKKVSPEARSSQSHKTRKIKSHHKTVYLHHRGLLEKHPASQLHGVASWYGKQFNHRRTASGVRFDTHAMMAAHRTLPFGTKVRVTNLANKRSCIVEITDRGPYARGRIIDVSFAAAAKLGMDRTGTAKVNLEILSRGEALPDIANDSEPDTLSMPAPIQDATVLPVRQTASMTAASLAAAANELP